MGCWRARPARVACPTRARLAAAVPRGHVGSRGGRGGSPLGGPAWPASVLSYDVDGLGAPFHWGHGLPQTLKRGTLFPGPYFWSFTDRFRGAGTRVKSGNSPSGNSLGRTVFACCCPCCFPLREPSCRRPLRGPASSCLKTHRLLPGPPKPPGQPSSCRSVTERKKNLRSFGFHNTRVFQNILFIHSKLGSARAQSRLDKQQASHRLGISASATGQRARVPAGPRECRTAGQSGVRGARGLRHRELCPGLRRCLHVWAPRHA